MKNSFLKIILALAFCLSPFIVAANSTDNISGYAWSSNIGWISFNCMNTDTCGTGAGQANYGVNKDENGNLVGYAWSPNVGWIKFGGLSGFPSSPTQDAQVVSGNLVGWARACAGTANGDCSTMTSRTDGWDGWISLSGTGYGVSFAGTNFSSYAWGSEVVGWVSFSGDGYGVTTNVIPVVTDTLTASDCLIDLGESSCDTKLNWTTANTELATSAITSPVNNSGEPDVDFHVADGNSGTDVLAPVIPYPSRTFYLYNNGVELSPAGGVVATASCDIGSIWDTVTTKCVAITATNCTLPWGDSMIAGSDPVPAYLSSSVIYPDICQFKMLSCDNDGNLSADGSDFSSYTNRTCSSVLDPACSPYHYNCTTGAIVSGSSLNSPTRWTWNCVGEDGVSIVSCFERKSPGVIEN